MTASHMRTNFALGPSTPTLWRLTRAPSSNNDKVSARRSACAIPTFAHRFRETVAVFGLDLFDHSPCGMVGFRQFDRRIREVAAPLVIEYKFGAASDPGVQLRQGIARVYRFDFGPPSFGFERHVAQTLNDQVVLRAEVTVERHLVGAGRLGDRIDANASDSVFVEQVPGGAGNPIARARPTSRRIPHSPEFLLKFVSHDY